MKASIAGVNLIADGPIVWRQTEGVRPYIGELPIRASDVETLMREAIRPVTLTIKNGEREEKFENLLILHDMPGANPYTARLVVADRRWLWNRGHIMRRFNVRRRTGVKRLEDPAQVRESMVLAPDVHYAPYSLLDGATMWTPLLALRELERAIVEHERDLGFDFGDFEIDGSVSSRLGQFPIENLEIDDSLDVGFEKLLHHLPEAQVTVGADGKVYVYSRANNSEKSLIDSSGDEVVGGGHVKFVRHNRTRPSEIRVMFERSIEVRLDAQEVEIGGTVARDPDGLFMENVLPVPDYTLTLANGDVVTQGNWITFDSALRAWNQQAPPGLGNLSIAVLRKASVPFVDLWAGMQLSGSLDPDNAWSARVGAMQAHFRRTYRVNRRFMDRLRQIHDYRVAVQDPSGTSRGAAQAYSDYAILPGQRFLLAQAQGTSDLSWIVNVAGYPQNDDEHITEDTKPAPAVVRVIDSDQGIIHIDWSVDPSRSYEQVLPSMVEMEGSKRSSSGKPEIPGPSGDLSNRRRSIAFNAFGPGLELPQLTADHKLSVILTATPGSPNTEAQFETVVVRPGDMRDVLPPELFESVFNSSGPAMEVRIGGTVEQARIAWVDKEEDRILQALGIKPTPEGQKLDLKDITINYSEGGFQNGFASLQSIARAEAARIWASMVDRHYGAKTVNMHTNIRPTGRIAAVTHTRGEDGSNLSTMELPRQQPSESIFSFMPGGVQRLIRRLANMGRA